MEGAWIMANLGNRSGTTTQRTRGSMVDYVQEAYEKKELILALAEAQAYATELEVELSKEMNKNCVVAWEGRDKVNGVATARLILPVPPAGNFAHWMAMPGEQMRNVSGIYISTGTNGEVLLTIV
jgi:hypothetical protein